MATRIRKTAGRCARCNKWVSLDDFEVVYDMTMAAIRPAWEKFHAAEHLGCGPECLASVAETARGVLTEAPVCSRCWHAMEGTRSLTTHMVDMIDGGVQAILRDDQLFAWKKVRRG